MWGGVGVGRERFSSYLIPWFSTFLKVLEHFVQQNLTPSSEGRTKVELLQLKLRGPQWGGGHLGT